MHTRVKCLLSMAVMACGAKKDLVMKGRYWEESYKSRCPNCNTGTPQ